MGEDAAVADDLIAREGGEGGAHRTVEFADDHLGLGRRVRRSAGDQGLAGAKDDAFTHGALSGQRRTGRRGLCRVAGRFRVSASMSSPMASWGPAAPSDAIRAARVVRGPRPIHRASGMRATVVDRSNSTLRLAMHR